MFQAECNQAEASWMTQQRGQLWGGIGKWQKCAKIKIGGGFASEILNI